MQRRDSVKGLERHFNGVQRNTSPVKSAGAAMIIRTGTTPGMLLVSFIDAERLGPQSH